MGNLVSGRDSLHNAAGRYYRASRKDMSIGYRLARVACFYKYEYKGLL